METDGLEETGDRFEPLFKKGRAGVGGSCAGLGQPGWTGLDWTG